MKNKKAQAAMEFLLTYGWAILVVLLVIMALAYFGVLSPKQFLPSRCDLESPLMCVDKQISTTNNEVKILVQNNNPNSIRITEATFIDTEGILGGDIEVTGMDEVIPSGEDTTIEGSPQGSSIAGSKGSKVKVGIEIVYSDIATNFNHTATGEILAALE